MNSLFLLISHADFRFGRARLRWASRIIFLYHRLLNLEKYLLTYNQELADNSHSSYPCVMRVPKLTLRSHH